jgi:hypothetical protein
MPNNIDPIPAVALPLGPQLVEPAPKPRNKSVEAYDIAEPVRDLIASEFRVVKSSRRLARKYRLPVHVVSDILHLASRKQPQSERLFVAARRQTA